MAYKEEYPMKHTITPARDVIIRDVIIRDVIIRGDVVGGY
jgi:hypothetical protein